MKARTKIPELESRLEENRKRRWTPDINRVILDYYVQFAHDSDLKGLTAYLNDRFETTFMVKEIISHYHKIKEM